MSSLGSIKSFHALQQQWKRKVVVVVMGATGTGKSKLAIELAQRFDGEVINCDKIQVHKGMDIVTNKVSEDESMGIPHHLLSFVDPLRDFPPQDFVMHGTPIIHRLITNGKLPIVAGGSTSFIQALLKESKANYEFYGIWIDVSLPVLYPILSARVDEMVSRGAVEEVREFYDTYGDATSGVAQAIGVPELRKYFKSEATLRECMDEMKINTWMLSGRQRQKITALSEDLGGLTERVDATRFATERSPNAWKVSVLDPSIEIVNKFLMNEVRQGPA
ncbi:hypothetical protein M569_04646 [Genlisea aurea]|uniref:Adenylate isopentenyltransferase n=1 Tax=Genlisea aurea TaxID=192259 RepID=S8CTF1_9LAMI|nr:hypothetical protein M569_04646 [Genlisea aurea]